MYFYLGFLHRLYFLDYERQEELLTLPVSRDEIDDLKISPGNQFMY